MSFLRRKIWDGFYDTPVISLFHLHPLKQDQIRYTWTCPGVTTLREF